MNRQDRTTSLPISTQNRLPGRPTLLSSAIALTLASVTPTLVNAQEASSQDNWLLEEITVTAQKREENLQDIAASATALTGEALTKKSVNQLDELQFASPSLSIADAGLTQSVNIRGVGLSSGSPSVANGVATYIDGVFQPPIVTTNSFYDVGSVEVFRGPQGTFVGSNSTGGAIFINSRNPDLSGINGYAEASVGNYGAYGFEGAINLPASDTLAFRGALNYQQRDSFYDDIGPANNEPDSLDEVAGRIGVLWAPNEQWQTLFKAEVADKKSGGYASKPLPGDPYLGDPDNGGVPEDQFTLANDSPAQNDETGKQASLELRYDTASGITIRSVSGYQHKEINNLYDLDRSVTPGLPQITQEQYVRERVWTEEINIISPTDGNLSWIVGAYYQRNRIDVDITQLTAGFPVDIDIANKKRTTGIFGQATYRFNDEWALDIGARRSTYDVSGTGAVVLGPGFLDLEVQSFDGDHNDSKPTGKISLNWTPDANTLVYAFVARGYKSGGFDSATSEFDPETVTDYELGWKSTLFDGHVKTQVGAFYYDYSDFQFDILNPASGQGEVVNLTDATIKGLELSAQAQFGELGFDFSVAYVDSNLSSAPVIDTRAFNRANPGAVTSPQCASGQVSTETAPCTDYTPYLILGGDGPNLYSPELTYNLGVEYNFTVNDMSITPRINYAYMDEQYAYIAYNDAVDRLDSRGLLSALVTVQIGNNYQVEVYGSNLTDEEYISGQSTGENYFGSPRQYGARVRYDF